MKPKNMKACEYYYGVKSLKGALEGELYEDALKLKIQLSEILIKRLLKVDMMERDSTRVNACINSQKFNRELLDELR